MSIFAQRTLAGPLFDSLVRPRARVPQFRWLLSIAVLVITFASLGIGLGLISTVIIGVGYIGSHFVERIPVLSHFGGSRYVLRTLVAAGSIFFVLLAPFVVPVVLPLLFSNAPITSLHPEFLPILCTAPLLTILGSERFRDYIVTTAACALSAGIYIMAWGMDLYAGLAASATIVLVSVVVWQLYSSYQNKVNDTEEFWRKIADYDQTKTLPGVFETLSRAAPEAVLYIHVPTQARWQRYNPSITELEWVEGPSALQKVLETRKHQWVNADLARTLFVPVPYTPPNQPPSRLRAVIQIPMERVGRWGYLEQLWNWISGQTSGWREDDLPDNYRIVAEALDHALDNWKTDRARNASSLASDQLQQLSKPSDAVTVAASVSDYFDCPVIIWSVDSGRWQCVAAHPHTSLIESFSATDTDPPTSLFRVDYRVADVCVNQLRSTDPAESQLLQMGYTHLVPFIAVSNNESLGALALVTSRLPQFKPREVNFLQSVTSHLGLAFNHIHTIEGYKTMVNIGIQSVTEIIKSLTKSGGTSQTVDDLQQTVAIQTLHLMHADSVVLYSLEPEEKIEHDITVILPCAVGDIKDRRSVERAQLKPNNAVYWLAKHWKRPVLAENTLQTFYDGRTRGVDGSDTFPVRESIASTCASALFFNNRLIGVIFVNYHQPQKFGEAAEQTFELVVSLAAHTLAISGYYQEWAAQTAYSERKRLRSRAHTDLKGIAQTMALRLKVLQRIADDPEKAPVLDEQLGVLVNQAERMAQISKEFLDLVDVSEWTELHYLGLGEVLQNRAKILIGNGLYTFHSNYPGILLLTQEKSLLDFGVEALLNAARYAPGASVSISLHWDEPCVTLTISDSGPGIPEAQLDETVTVHFRALREAAGSNNYTIRNLENQPGLEVSMCVQLNTQY